MKRFGLVTAAIVLVAAATFAGPAPACAHDMAAMGDMDGHDMAAAPKESLHRSLCDDCLT